VQKRSYTQLRKISKEVCRNLRKQATPAERLLWQELRGRRFCDLKFYRQRPLFVDLGDSRRVYVADFYCAELHLVIELDGRIHELTQDQDRAREQAIQQLGITTIRFKNEKVERNLSIVLDALKGIVERHRPL
jgi:very-short-patch-repair endonuclease